MLGGPITSLTLLTTYICYTPHCQCEYILIWSVYISSVCCPRLCGLVVVSIESVEGFCWCLVANVDCCHYCWLGPIAMHWVVHCSSVCSLSSSSTRSALDSTNVLCQPASQLSSFLFCSPPAKPFVDVLCARVIFPFPFCGGCLPVWFTNATCQWSAAIVTYPFVVPSVLVGEWNASVAIESIPIVCILVAIGGVPVACLVPLVV